MKKYCFLFIFFIIFINKINADVKISLYNIPDSNYMEIKKGETLPVHINITDTNIADSFNVIGIYLNFDTKYLTVQKIEFDSSRVYYLVDNVSGHFIDSNSANITLQVNKKLYNNNSGTINLTLFVETYPDLNATSTNFMGKIATIYFNPINAIDTTNVEFNFIEPRKTTLSQVGTNKISNYDTIILKIYPAPATPYFTNIFNDSIISNSSFNFTGWKEKTLDTVNLYINNNLTNSDVTSSGTSFNISTTFLNSDTYYLKLNSIDSASHISETSVQIKIIVDTISPTIISYSPLSDTKIGTTKINVNYSDSISAIKINSTKIYIDTGIGYTDFSNLATVTNTNLNLSISLTAGTCSYKVIVSDNANNTSVIIQTFNVKNNFTPFLTNSLTNIITEENTTPITINLNNYASDSDVSDSIYWSVYNTSGNNILNYQFIDTNKIKFTVISDTFGSETFYFYITDTKDTISTQFNISLSNIPNTPAIPVLSFPTNNYDTISSTTLSFNWSSDSTTENSETYQFQIDTSINFNSINLINYDTTLNQITLNNLNDAVYYWRVRGKNSRMTGDWSLINILTVGKDYQSPTISNNNILDEHNLAIDNTDTGIQISSYAQDNIGILTLSYYIGINDTTYSTENHFWDHPSNDTYSYTFKLSNTLNIGDSIYYKIYAADQQGNTSVATGFTIVSEVVITTPVFSPNIKRLVNNSTIYLYGTKYPSSNVKINNLYTASNISDTQWALSYPLVNEGTNVITAKSFLGSSESETESFTLVYDKTPPTLSDNTPSTTYASSFNISITASDNLSAVDSIYYSLNNLAWQTGTNILIDTNGFYTLKYYGIDNAGNTSTIYTASNIAKFDSVPPILKNIYDEGDLSTDTTLEFSWDLPSDSSSIIDYYIEISKDTNFSLKLYNLWIGNNNLSYSITSDSFAEGETYYFKIKAKDIVGNISDFSAISDGISIDTSVSAGTPPAKPGINNFSETVTTLSITLSGTKTIDAKSVIINGSLADVNDAAGTWTKTIILSAGLNNIYIYSKNEYGIKSDSYCITIYMDNVAPGKPTYNVVSPTNNSIQIISGYKDIDAETIYVNDTIAEIISDTTWRINFNLNSINNTLNVWAADKFGNQSDTESKSIYYDSVPPNIPTINYTTPYSGYSQTLSGSFDTVNVTVIKVNDTPASLNTFLGVWQTDIALNTEETNSITLKAYDNAGNTVSKTINIYRDVTGPKPATITSPLNNITTSASPIIVSGTIPLNAYGIKTNDTYITNLSGTYSVSVPLVVGSNLIVINSIDNLYNLSNPVSIVIDYDPSAFLVYSNQLDNNSILDNIPDSLLIQFNSNINTNTINSTNVQLIYNYNGSELNYTTQFINNEYNKFYIIPTIPFKIHNTYKLIVKKEITNLENKTLQQDNTWIFRTGSDTIAPVISNLTIKDDEKKILVDNTDTGIYISCNVEDSGSGIKFVRLELGINNSNRDDYNFTFMSPTTTTINFEKLFITSLSDSYILYYGVYAEDTAGNFSLKTDTILVGSIEVPKPTLDLTIDTIINYSPIILKGNCDPEADVYINGIKATKIDTISWQVSMDLSAGINNMTIYSQIVNSKSKNVSYSVIYDLTKPTATANVPAIPMYDSVLVTITPKDDESGIKKILVSLNNNNFIETNTVLISNEYKNTLKYIVENNAELFSDTYSQIIYIDRTKPDFVKTYDEGDSSYDKALIWSWDTPSDSSSIDSYYIEVSNTNNFSNIIYNKTIDGNNNLILVSSDTLFENNKTYYCRVAAIDIAGNKSDTSNNFYWTDGIAIDTNLASVPPPPSPQIIKPVNLSETNIVNIRVYGKKDTSAVNVSVNGVLAINSDTTNWYRDISLSIGYNTVLAVARNYAGIESPADTLYIILDNIPPAKPTITTSYSIVNFQNIEIKGTKENGSIIEINGSTSDITSTATTYSKLFTQSENTTKYKVVALDSLGNRSDTAEINITVDLTKPITPTVNFVSPVNTYKQLISGTLEPNTEISINGSTTQILVSNNQFQYEISLNEDTNNFIVKTIDSAGNYSETSFVVFVDVTAPKPPKILSPINNYQTAEANIIVSGTKPVNSYAYVNGVKADTNNYSDTSWQTTVSLYSGSNLIIATTKDKLGNQSTVDQIIVNFNINLFLAESLQLDNKEFLVATNKIYITLNKSLDISTLTTSNIYLIEDGKTNVLPDLSYDDISKKITITNNLKPCHSYTLYVKNDILSSTGHNLSQTRIWQFTVLIDKDTETISEFNNNFKIKTEAGSFNENVYFTVETISPGNANIILADKKISADNTGFYKSLDISRSIFDIKCYDEKGETITTFTKPITIFFNYPDADQNGIVDNTDLNENFLKLFYLDETSNDWEKVTSQLDANNNYVISDLNHLSTYTLFGSSFNYSDIKLYPNPTPNKKINLTIRPTTNTTVDVNIINPFGRDVYKKSFNALANILNSFVLDLQKLPFGGYYAQIKIGNTTKLMGIGIGGK